MRFLPVLCLFAWPSISAAYSVLTHEAIIDSAWEGTSATGNRGIGIKPLLRRRFPDASPDDLRRAYGFAYGGAIIQDLGYYPAGSHLFSDLTHYIRSGTFVLNLLSEASNLNEYAFALGALAHYAADDEGHSIAVNQSVPLLYPKLQQRFGPLVTYEDDPSSHLKTEFAFDVLQVARGFYAPQAYHDFIGFAVAKPLLDRAFEKTYCLPLEDVFEDLDRALGSYRHNVSRIIPEATKVAWLLKRKDIEKAKAGITRRKFIYNVSRANYEKEWSGNYDRPGVGARILAFFVRILPKVGPLKDLAFRAPTPKTEDLFMKSFDSTLDQYRSLLEQVGTNPLHLVDMNFDTGQPAHAGVYHLADEAQAKWIGMLQERGIGCDTQPRRIITVVPGDTTPANRTVTSYVPAVRSSGSRPFTCRNPS